MQPLYPPAVINHLQTKYGFTSIPGQLQVGDRVTVNGKPGIIIDDFISIELSDGTTTTTNLRNVRRLL